MASGGVIPSAIGKPKMDAMLVDKLPEEINEMKIKDEKVEKVNSRKYSETWYNFFSIYCFYLCGILVNGLLFQEMEAAVVDGNGTETGHIIVTTIGGKNGQPKQVIAFKISSLWLKSLWFLTANHPFGLTISRL